MMSNELKTRFSLFSVIFFTFFINLQKNKKKHNTKSRVASHNEHKFPNNDLHTDSTTHSWRQKSKREPAVHTYIQSRRELFLSVCGYLCKYYFAVIVTDFLMRAKKILKFTFLSAASRANRMRVFVYLPVCACVGWKWTTITVKKYIYNTAQESRKLSKYFLSFTFACRCRF